MNNIGVQSYIENIATNVLIRSIAYHTNLYYLVNFDLDNLQYMFVMWQNRKSIMDLTNNSNIPNHNKEDKIRKIEYFKNAVLQNRYTDTTLFAMRIDKDSPIVITDGIHRAISIQRALVEDPSIKEKINLRILLFEGKRFEELDDYRLSIPEPTH